jgi:Flp pilus assembly protein TadD
MKNFSFLFIAVCLCLTVSASSQTKFDVKKSLSEAASLLQTGNFAEAEKILSEAKKLAPANADVHNLLGIIYDQKGDFKQAEIAYRTAIKLKPKAVSPLANLGILLAKAKREKEATNIFESVLKLNPNHPQTIINLGFLYSSTGKFPQAVEFLQKANVIQPNSPDILFKLGTALFQIKKFDQARQIFEELNFADADFMIGEILAKQNRYSEAAQFYEKALAQDKSKDVYFIRLGGIYLLQSQFNQALTYFKEASELFPEVAEIKYFLALTLRGLGNYDLAMAELQKSLSLKETADSNALLGAILFDRNEFAEAEKYLRKAVLLNPRHFNSHYDLGRLLVKQQRLPEALPILQKAAALMPNNADVHYQLFLSYSRLKRRTEADKALAIFKKLSGH